MMKRRNMSWKLQIIIALLFVISVLTFHSIEAKNGDDDLDGDGLPDDWENLHGLDLNNSDDAGEDPDMDGLTNTDEYNHSTDPNKEDTDGDGVDDGTEVTQGSNPLDPDNFAPKDSDDDEMPDYWESQNSLDPHDDSDAKDDADRDGYSNLLEFKSGTDPNDFHDRPEDVVPDTDGDDEKEDSGMLGMGTSRPAFLILFLVIPLVLLIVIVLVYTKMKREQLLEHQVRNNIYNYVNKNPGVHYRGIMHDLNLQMGVLTHHLNMLEHEQYIKSVQDGMYRRFYPKDAQVKSGLILSDIQERILRMIHSTPGISQSGVARNLGLARKVVNYHVKILTDAGFVHVEPSGRESRCYYIDGLELEGPAQPPQYPAPAPQKPDEFKMD